MRITQPSRLVWLLHKAASIRDYCAQPEQRAKIEAAVKAVCDKVLDAMPGVIGEVTAKVLERAVYAAANERDR